MKVMRGMAGQKHWLAQQCRMDLAYGAHKLFKRSKKSNDKGFEICKFISEESKK